MRREYHEFDCGSQYGDKPHWHTYDEPQPDPLSDLVSSLNRNPVALAQLGVVDPNEYHEAVPGTSNTVCTVCGRWESNGIHEPERPAPAHVVEYEDGYRAGWDAARSYYGQCGHYPPELCDCDPEGRPI